jgi:hypothetical protein
MGVGVHLQELRHPVAFLRGDDMDIGLIHLRELRLEACSNVGRDVAPLAPPVIREQIGLHTSKSTNLAGISLACPRRCVGGRAG